MDCSTELQQRLGLAVLTLELLLSNEAILKQLRSTSSQTYMKTKRPEISIEKARHTHQSNQIHR